MSLLYWIKGVIITTGQCQGLAQPDTHWKSKPSRSTVWIDFWTFRISANGSSQCSNKGWEGVAMGTPQDPSNVVLPLSCFFSNFYTTLPPRSSGWGMYWGMYCWGMYEVHTSYCAIKCYAKICGICPWNQSHYQEYMWTGMCEGECFRVCGD